MTHRILCVDPDESDRGGTVESVRTDLADLDPVLETAGTLSGAEAALGADLDAIITEYDLPDGTGFDLVGTAREVAPDVGCILYTDTDLDTIDTAELQGTVMEYVGKGSVFGSERLTELLRTTIETGAQNTYPLPQNEAERVAALRSFDLDNPELQSSLDRVTDLAAEHFGVDVASINIIGEHSQEFLSCYGESSEWETMDRADSICTFTILEDDNVMTVEDVTEDPRFESRSDSLLELGIRAYMGANLVTSSGLEIGPLCVYDDEPRSFSVDDEAYLKRLASVAMDIVELHARIDGTAAADGGKR